MNPEGEARTDPGRDPSIDRQKADTTGAVEGQSMDHKRFSDAQWEAVISAACRNRPMPLRAKAYVKRLSGWSNPVLVECDDGNTYVVKGRQIKRAIVNEQIAAYLGRALGAPIPDTPLIEVRQELIDRYRNGMSHVTDGIAHGSRLVPNCSNRHVDCSIEPVHDSDKNLLMQLDSPHNRERFAVLAILYGWTQTRDGQLIYSDEPPHLVYSVDHGHSFPGGPDWTVEHLDAAGMAVLHRPLVAAFKLTSGELQPGRDALAKITCEQIAEAAARPHGTWSFRIEDRVAVARFLEKRINDLLPAY